jgi:glycosyltransferase involved in cell wall biosynthesis
VPSPRVSILIPAYNERYFAEAFASARAQSYASLEIVVCDDSPGRSIEDAVVAARDARVRYLRNGRRLGFEGNFTECLRQARGELVKFLNDDDRLRPDCVGRLAEAFQAHARLRLATSRRQVIGEDGTARADLPATSPVSYASCVIEGFELGDLALVNGLNLIGEPSTVMFRRDDVQPEAGGVFTWGGKSYHCLADLSLWLRLLAGGGAYYCASPLSEYRVHPGQEQRGADMGIDCITERFDLVNEARRAGFLATAPQCRAALSRVEALSAAWRERSNLPAGQRETLQALSVTIAGALASLAHES